MPMFDYTLRRADSSSTAGFMVTATDRNMADVALISRLRQLGWSEADMLYWYVESCEQLRGNEPERGKHGP